MKAQKNLIVLLIAVFLLSTVVYLHSQADKYDTRIKGEIVKVSSDKITVEDNESGKKIVFTLDSEVDIEEETLSKLSSIKDETYGKVYTDSKNSIIEEGKTDTVYIARKVTLCPDNEKQKIEVSGKKLRGFISYKDGKIKVKTDNETYTLEPREKKFVVVVQKQDLGTEALKKGQSVEVKGNKDGKTIIAEFVKINTD